MNLSLVEPRASARHADDLLSSIGRTPLIRLRRVTGDLPAGVELYAKAEHLNPGGSVKDRAALAMILEGERAGKLDRGKQFSTRRAGIPERICDDRASRGYAVTLVCENATSSVTCSASTRESARPTRCREPMARSFARERWAQPRR